MVPSAVAGGRRRRGAGAGHRDRPELREAKVEQLDATLGHHHVAWLQVAMDDPLAMGGVERVSDQDAVAKDLIQRKGAVDKAAFQRLPFKVLHDQEVDVAVLTDIVEYTDVGVRQRRNGPFALEAVPTIGILTVVAGQGLDRHRAIQSGVTGLVNLAHAARADEGQDFVRAQPCAWHKPRL